MGARRGGGKSRRLPPPPPPGKSGTFLRLYGGLFCSFFPYRGLFSHYGGLFLPLFSPYGGLLRYVGTFFVLFGRPFLSFWGAFLGACLPPLTKISAGVHAYTLTESHTEGQCLQSAVIVKINNI